MDSKLYNLLQLLDTDCYRTSSELASKLDVSEKTIRNRIIVLKEVLAEHGAEILSKRHYGHQLKITDESKFLQVAFTPSGDEIPDSHEDRQIYLLKFFLETNDYIKLDDLSEQLYISRNTLSANLKRVEAILKTYDLEIDRRPNYGLRLIGSEFNRRTCLVNNLYKFFKDENLEKELTTMILEGNQKANLAMSEIGLENFVQYLIVSIARIGQGHPIEEGEVEREPIDQKTLSLVKSYSRSLSERMSIKFSDSEIRFLSIHFGSKISSDSYSQYSPNFVIHSKIDELVFKMLTRVYEAFAMDFRGNLELRMSLIQHLVPMDIRIRFRIPIKNPLLEMIQSEYPYPYTLAQTASTALVEYYQVEIPDDEVAYIAIIFALATEKRNRIIEKKNIVLVCVTGKSSSQLFKYKYLQAFGEYIDTVYECTVADLEEFDFSSHHIDYIFTTVPLRKKYPVPIYEINLFMDTNDILTYRQFFQKGDKRYLLNYYSTNLFLPHLKAQTKEEVLSQMCQVIDHYGLLPDGFYEAVLKRETLGPTDFGNMVALPHPYKMLSQQSFVCVAILEKPILWQQNMVQVIFLLSIGSKEDPNLESFYQKTSSLFFDKEAIQTLIENPSFETLMSIFD